MDLTEITESAKWFKRKYQSDQYGVAVRDFKALCIIHGHERHKVIDTYHRQDGTYFLVYKKQPVIEKKIYEGTTVYFDEAGC
ncbi:MAG: hypothetical protein ACYCT7_09895 [bacterium]